MCYRIFTLTVFVVTVSFGDSMITYRTRQLLHACGALLLTMAVTNWAGAQNGDGYQHVIVATPRGDVNEVYFKGGGAPIGQARLAHFDGIVGIAGYFGADDNYQHVIVATPNGDVHELYFKGGGAPIGQTRLAHFDGIVAIAGYFTASDNYQHVIVATRNGDVHEVYFKGGGAAIGQTRLAHFDSIVAIAGYFAASDNYQHVIVATRNGDVHEVYFKGGGAPIGQTRLAHFNDIVGVAGYFAAGDSYQHVIVATRNGDVHEVYFKGGGAPIAQARLAHSDGIVGVAAYFGSGDNYQHVIVATQNGDVNEVYFKGGGVPIGQARLAHFDGIVGVAGYFGFPSNALTWPPGSRYNEVYQKSAHNTFQKNEDLLDVLLYHRVRSIEFDLSLHHTAGGPTVPKDDWYLLHGDSVADYFTNYKWVSSALERLAAFHRAFPDHEVVTLWVDNAIDDNDASHDSAAFDRLFEAFLGNALFKPRDLLASCNAEWQGSNRHRPGDIKSLHEAIRVGNCPWPRLDELRGRIIVVSTSGFGSYASGLESRAAFLASMNVTLPEFFFFNYGHADSNPASPLYYARELTDAEWQLGLAANVNHFVSRVYNTCTLSGIETPGSAHRCGTDSPAVWARAVENRFNHIATNYVNDKTAWTRTQNARGYPFCPLGITSCGPQFSDRIEGGSTGGKLYTLTVDSEDLEVGRSTTDNIGFAPDFRNAPRNFTLSGFIGVPSDSVNDWAKGCLMIRGGLESTAPYYAVCRPADNHGPVVQYRSLGCRGACGTASANSSFGEDAVFVRLDVQRSRSPDHRAGLRVAGRSALGGYR